MKKTDVITLGSNYKIFKRSVPHHDKLQNSIAKYIKNYKHKIVVDLGCGLGYTTESVLKVCNPEHLYLVDYDKRMFLSIFENKKILNKKNIKISVSNEDILNFLDCIKDNTIDCIYSCWVIHNLKKIDRAKIIKEVYRVLKKGGVFINGDKYSEMNELNHAKSFSWQEDQYNKAIAKHPNDKLIYKGWISHHHEDDKNRFTEQEQNELAKNVGFKKYEFLERFYLESIFKAQK